MKKEFTLENLKSIEVDKENNLVIAHYEEEKTGLKVGEWYTGGTGIHRLIINNETCYEIAGLSHRINKHCNFKTSKVSVNKPADMSKVKELLIKEAENRGFKEGVVIIPTNTTNRIRISGYNFFGLANHGLILDNNCIFSFKTGKWAEIVKKPLYTNDYGTEFFEGDKAFFIHFKENTIEPFGNGCIYSYQHGNFAHGNETSEIMTKRECHRYLYENWDKLKK